MDYQVWTKDEFGDQWNRDECGDLGAAKRELIAALKTGKEATLTVEVPFSLELKVGEPGAERKLKAKEKYRAGVKQPEEEVESEADQDPTEQD